MFDFVIWCVGLCFMAIIAGAILEAFFDLIRPASEETVKWRQERNKRESQPIW